MYFYQNGRPFSLLWWYSSSVMDTWTKTNVHRAFDQNERVSSWAEEEPDWFSLVNIWGAILRWQPMYLNWSWPTIFLSRAHLTFIRTISIFSSPSPFLVCVCLFARACVGVGELCFIIAVFWLFYDFSFPAKLELSATTWEMEPIASFQEIHSYHTAQYHTAVVQHKTPYNAVLYCTIP